MRNDNKPWKRQGYKSGGRTGKQFGGPLARPGAMPAQPLARPLAQPGVAPVGLRGFKGGARVKKVHGGITRPLARPVLKGGKTAKAGGGYVYKKK